MKDLMQMLGKKGMTEVEPQEKESKMEILMELRDLMSKLIGEDSQEEDGNEMQQVTVAAQDPKHLEMGLDKAKDVVGMAKKANPLAGLMDEEEDEYC